LTPEVLPDHGWFTIRDKYDEKVLYSAITADVDILITGDKDFFDIEIEKPEILTPHDFVEKYVILISI
jgi:predicted nucleic acid-binding protein